MSPTLLNKYIAIPHGNPLGVKIESIAVIKLDNPIEWYKDIKVSMIFLLALNEYSREKFNKLFKLVNDKKYLTN